jgi:hypothetical protein
MNEKVDIDYETVNPQIKSTMAQYKKLQKQN